MIDKLEGALDSNDYRRFGEANPEEAGTGTTSSRGFQAVSHGSLRRTQTQMSLWRSRLHSVSTAQASSGDVTVSNSTAGDG